MRSDSVSWVLVAAAFLWPSIAPAATSIDSAHPHAYGANVGWVNFRGDVANGAVLGYTFCTGYVWSANCGWICLGNGPTNGWHYSNAAANDWGVNHDGQGRLSGFAYGANIGWIQFEQTNGRPRIDLLTGNLSGYAYGANVGWISLSNAQALVKTARLDAGPDADGDGISDPWESRMAGGTTRLWGGGHDADEDGATDEQEAGADTDPLDDTDFLAIIDLQRQSDTNRLTWRVEPTRFYRLEQTVALTNNAPWPDSGFGQMLPDPGATMTRRVIDPASTTRFYRVKAVVPLSP
jgi:hypothetical protein